MSELLLGVDVGTSSVKALACDSSGRIVATCSAAHPIHQPHAGWSEQNPEDWWTSSVSAIRGVLSDPKCDGSRVIAVGLSGQMHGSVFLPAGSETPIRPALLWNDQRTAEQCRSIEQAFGGRRAMVSMVGNAALTGFTLPKIIWLREREPENFAKVATVLLPKDYVRLKLDGRRATDVGDASGTLLFDIEARRWSRAALSRVGLDPAILPDVVESGEVTGRVTPAAAAETGLPAGTPVIAGSGDNQAGAVGAGIVRSGLVLATIGTSGVMYAHSDSPRRDLQSTTSDRQEGPEPVGRLHTMCAANGSRGIPGQYSLTGCMLSAGGSLQWCRDALFPGESFEALMAEAEQVRPGCDGLVFLPYLTGERCPYPDPQARGGWIGLTSRHTRGHLVRAVIEGVTFGMGQILDLVRGLGVEVESVRLGGGGARSALWRQLQADVYRCRVATMDTEEGPAFGAALLAGVGAGVFPNVAEACRTAVHESGIIDPRDSSAYDGARQVYGSLYTDLGPRFAALHGMDQS